MANKKPKQHKAGKNKPQHRGPQKVANEHNKPTLTLKGKYIISKVAAPSTIVRVDVAPMLQDFGP